MSAVYPQGVSPTQHPHNSGTVRAGLACRRGDGRRTSRPGSGGGPRARRGACWWGCRRRGWPSPRRAWAQERVSIARVRSVAPRGCAARCARARRARQRLAPGARLVGDAGEAHHGQGRDRQRDLVQPAHAEPHAAARPDAGSVWAWGGVATRHSGGATRAPAVPRRCASHAAPRPPPTPSSAPSTLTGLPFSLDDVRQKPQAPRTAPRGTNC